MNNLPEVQSKPTFPAAALGTDGTSPLLTILTRQPKVVQHLQLTDFFRKVWYPLSLQTHCQR